MKLKIFLGIGLILCVFAGLRMSESSSWKHWQRTGTSWKKQSAVRVVFHNSYNSAQGNQYTYKGRDGKARMLLASIGL